MTLFALNLCFVIVFIDCVDPLLQLNEFGLMDSQLGQREGSHEFNFLLHVLIDR